ncbi:hypothetical protein SAMN05444394_0765 [Algoriphagus halophilus]|uniref:Uncharacterized protein n=1 Tax=Algoriphagus halophilus TaxID=226505 RepID=A0A1N6DDU4_9BACT|nr:hypothetical protein SAMN05444394_0765 [Algoriphagus halophilus]
MFVFFMGIEINSLKKLISAKELNERFPPPQFFPVLNRGKRMVREFKKSPVNRAKKFLISQSVAQSPLK